MAESTKSKTPSNAGNLYLMFLGFLLMLMGCAFTFLMWMSFARANTTRNWQETPCKILKSKLTERKIEGHNLEYNWDLEYSYSFGGKDFVSSRESHKDKFDGKRPRINWTKHKEKVEEKVKDHPVGKATVCFVNPDKPSFALLKHDSRGAGYSIWFPMLFAVGGIGMIVGAIRKWHKSPNKNPQKA